MSQPSRLGRITLWPRLEIGNSSETPWSRPRTIACQYVMSVPATTRSSGGGGARPRGRALEPREDQQRDAEEERGDPVLDVMVVRAGLVARQPGGQRVRRLDPVVDAESDQDDPGNRGDDDHGPAVQAHGETIIAAATDWLGEPRFLREDAGVVPGGPPQD